MRKVAIFAAVSLLGMSVPTALIAGDGDQAGTTSKDKMVCKERRKTGTRFSAKTCRTVEQWEKMAEEHRRAGAETINRPMIEIRRDQ